MAMKAGWKSWHHLSGEQGSGVTSIGKLHFRADEDPVGFEESIIPMNIDGGTGDIRGYIKRPMAPPLSRSKTAEMIGPGESSYTKYDHEIMEKSCAFIKEKGANKNGPALDADVLVCLSASAAYRAARILRYVRQNGFCKTEDERSRSTTASVDSFAATFTQS